MNTSTKILEAARRRLLAEGYAAISTRKVAEEAGVPLSQIHYHFGSKDELILALLRAETDTLLARQTEMFEQELPLWKRWDLACDYFDVDIATGYVRVLQEMTAAGWSSETVGKEMRHVMEGWTGLVLSVARDAENQGMGFGGFTAKEAVALIASAFVGAESLILLGMEGDDLPFRSALRKVGDLIRIAEEEPTHAS